MASGYDGTLVFDTKIDASGLNAGMKNIASSFGKLKSALVALGIGALVKRGVSALSSFGKEAIGVASDLQEVQNVVDTVFENSAETIEDFAATASRQFGLSELAAKRFTSTMGAMLKSMGFAEDDATEMSVALAGLAGDMASFYNLDAEDAFNKLRAGISGETEPLKQLGINLSAANLEAFALSEGLGKTYKSMTEAEKAAARYQYILAATADAQGDFAKTSDSWANQTRILSLEWQTFLGNIGSGFMAAAKPVLKMFGRVLSALNGFIGDSAASVGEFIGGKIERAIQVVTQFGTAVYNAFSTLSEYVGPVLAELWQNVSPILEGIRTAAENTFENMRLAWETVLRPVFDEFMAKASALWTEHLQPLWENFSSLVGELVSAAIEIYNEFISPLVTAFVEEFGPPIAKVLGFVGDVVFKVRGIILDVITAVIGAVRGVVQFIAGVFTGDWERAWQGVVDVFDVVFGGVGDILKGVVNIVIGLINSMISFVTTGVNKILEQVNKISIDLPESLGGGHIGFDFDLFEPYQIPLLATGAVLPANQPFLAMLGDQKNGRNLEAPEGLIRQIMREELAGMGNGEVVIRFGGDMAQLVRVLKPYIDRENSRAGSSLVTGGVF